MRFLACAALAAGVLIASCATREGTITTRVDHDGATFIVLTTRTYSAGFEDDLTKQLVVYQVADDGRYRHLGTRGEGGLGVFSEEDRRLVATVVAKAQGRLDFPFMEADGTVTQIQLDWDEDDVVFVTLPDGSNVDDPATAAGLVSGKAPQLVESPGALRYRTGPQPTPAPEPEPAGTASPGIDDTQGE